MRAAEKLPLLRFLEHLEEGVLVLLMSTLIVLACAQILLRNFFSITLLWSDALIRHLVLWTSLVGALIAARQHKHIHIDALQRLLPQRHCFCMAGVAHLFSALICGLLSWIALHFIADERAFGARAFFEIPTWKLQLIFPLSFGIMSLRFLAQGLRDLRRFARGEEA